MTPRERALAVLRYQSYDRLPLIHFGFWEETLEKWAAEGHLEGIDYKMWGDGNQVDRFISERLGFDFNWARFFEPDFQLRPPFKRQVVRTFPDGSRHVRDENGVVLMEKPGAGSIPAEIEHLLTDRQSWQEHYQWRLTWVPERVRDMRQNATPPPPEEREFPFGLFCGSLYGLMRNLIGFEGACYLAVDDEPLFDEILESYAELSFQNVKAALETGIHFDFAHFWEDICFKNGPLVSPGLFREKVGPHYRRITELLNSYGIDLISLDCDGNIDALLPIWLENGINIMFPIEVGTWKASIKPWREQYGRDLRGVGGVDKTVFSRDRRAVDEEVERLRPLIDLGGYLPCIDHRLAPDASWDLVRYYADKMKSL
jgi:uroporphyrinogen decarboxylase